MVPPESDGAARSFGNEVPMRTGNVAAVVKTMTHRDLKPAMHYQHPVLDVVRTVLD
jgi:hypothetical protein